MATFICVIGPDFHLIRQLDYQFIWKIPGVLTGNEKL